MYDRSPSAVTCRSARGPGGIGNVACNSRSSAMRPSSSSILASCPPGAVPPGRRRGRRRAAGSGLAPRCGRPGNRPFFSEPTNSARCRAPAIPVPGGRQVTATPRSHEQRIHLRPPSGRAGRLCQAAEIRTPQAGPELKIMHALHGRPGTIAARADDRRSASSLLRLCSHVPPSTSRYGRDARIRLCSQSDWRRRPGSGAPEWLFRTLH